MFENTLSRRSAIAAAGVAGLSAFVSESAAADSRDTSERSGATLVIEFLGALMQDHGFEVAPGKSVRLEIPKEFTADHVALAKKDAEILAGILKEHPSEIGQIVSLIAAGKHAEAKAVAKTIGLTEEDFAKKSGGCWAVVIVIAVVAAVALAHD